MLAAIALLFTALALWYGQQYWRIAFDEATAPVVSLRVESEPKLGKIVLGDPRRYVANYRFVDANGGEHAVRQSISRDMYEKLSAGVTPPQVHYSRSNPDLSVLDLEAVRWASIILAVVAAVVWIAALVRVFC